jgi:hypothetical protein
VNKNFYRNASNIFWNERWRRTYTTTSSWCINFLKMVQMIYTKLTTQLVDYTFLCQPIFIMCGAMENSSTCQRTEYWLLRQLLRRNCAALSLHSVWQALICFSVPWIPVAPRANPTQFTRTRHSNSYSTEIARFILIAKGKVHQHVRKGTKQGGIRYAQRAKMTYVT